MNRTNTKLVESAIEIFGNIDRLLKLRRPDIVCHRIVCHDDVGRGGLEESENDCFNLSEGSKVRAKFAEEKRAKIYGRGEELFSRLRQNHTTASELHEYHV